MVIGPVLVGVRRPAQAPAPGEAGEGPAPERGTAGNAALRASMARRAAGGDCRRRPGVGAMGAAWSVIGAWQAARAAAGCG